MEYNYLKINKKLKELIDLRLNRGVQPSELMESIFNEEYTKIKAKNISNGVLCEVEFNDCELLGDIISKYKYRYIYNNDMFLIQIRMIKNKRETIIWDRVDEEKNIVDDIILEMKILDYNQLLKEKIITTLPEDIKNLFQDRYIISNAI